MAAGASVVLVRTIADRWGRGPVARRAADRLKVLLAAASADQPEDTAGVLVWPERYGLALLGRVEWIDDPVRYAATVVLTDSAGQVFAATLTGGHAEAEADLARAEAMALEPVAAGPGPVGALLGSLRDRFAGGPWHPGCAAEQERLVCAVRCVPPLLAAA